MQIVEITISGGAVQYVKFPRGIKVIIRDYDVEGGDLDGPDIHRDKQGDPYQRMEFNHEEDSKNKRPPKPQNT